MAQSAGAEIPGSALGRSRPEPVAITSKADLAGELRRLLREAEARGGRTMSRAGLAKRIGVSQSSLYAYLNGTTFIPDDALCALLRELKADRELVLRLRWARGRLVEPMPPQVPVLPLDLPSFVARIDLLAELDRLRSQARKASTVAIAVVSGAGGIGKTTLAVRWAHRRLSGFPDGCLYLDLRGFHPDSPLDPGEALAALLRRLGVPGTSVPLGSEERRERYLQMLSGKRLLLVLDNAFSAEQVRPLLPPGTSSCFVLVTSRDRLSGLVVGSGACPLPVAPLPDAQAHALLAARLGDARVAAEPDAAATIVAACAGLPLALSAVAGRAQSNPSLALEALAAELGDARTRSRALDQGDAVTAVGTVLSWSLASLTGVQARVFALFGIAPGPDLALPAAASLVGLPLAETKAVLEELERVSLVQQDGPERYRMHDVVRHYAAETAQRELEPGEREAAVRRVVDFYIHTAHAADGLLDPHRPGVEPDAPVAGVHVHPLTDRSAALAWFDAEHTNLLAAQRAAVSRQWHLAVWHLARDLSVYHTRRGQHHSRLITWQAVLDTPGEYPDVAFTTYTHRALGRALNEVGRHEEAIDHLAYALALSEQHDDVLQRATTHLIIMGVWFSVEDYGRALSHAVRSVELFRELGNEVGQGHALSGSAWSRAHLDDYEAAKADCEAALILYRRHGCGQPEADVLDTLGYIHYHTGNYIRAVEYGERAVGQMRSLDETNEDLAAALDRLGQSHVILDHFEQARIAWRAALDLYQQRGRDEDVRRVQRKLDALDQRDSSLAATL